MKKAKVGPGAKVGSYEGSKADMAEDRKMAKKMKIPLKAYERSAADRKADAKGQKALDAKKKK